MTIFQIKHAVRRGILLTSILGYSVNAHAEVTVEEVKEAVLKELRQTPPATAPVPPTPASALTPSNAFNPAIGMVLDIVASNTKDNRGDFEFRSAELNLQAAVDPFGRAYAIINGNPDEVEVEEAAVVTNPIAGLFTLRGGRFFANFGRLAKWHDHELPFVRRTDSLEDYIGGEARADGLELTHLFATPFFLQGTLGAMNKIGSENDRLKESGGGGNGQEHGRGWNAFTYLGRLFTYIPMGDDFGVDIGVSEAITPKMYYLETGSGRQRVDSQNTQRWLSGADVTFRYEPTRENVYRKLIWGTEVFHNSERFGFDSNADTVLDTFKRRNTWGGYSYVDWRFARLFSAGGFFDLSESLGYTDSRPNTKTYGTFINILPSEFQRIRIQLSSRRTNFDNFRDHQIFVQWMATIGTHAHTFKDR